MTETSKFRERLVVFAAVMLAAVSMSMVLAEPAAADSGCWYYAQTNGTAATFKYSQWDRWCGDGANITTTKPLPYNTYWGYTDGPAGGVFTWIGNVTHESGCYSSGGIQYCQQHTVGDFKIPPFGPHIYPYHYITVGGDGSHWGTAGA